MRAAGIKVPKNKLRERVLLARGVREGLITPAVLPPGAPRRASPAGVMTLAELLADLDHLREDR